MTSIRIKSSNFDSAVSFSFAVDNQLFKTRLFIYRTAVLPHILFSNLIIPLKATKGHNKKQL